MNLVKFTSSKHPKSKLAVLYTDHVHVVRLCRNCKLASQEEVNIND